jgi:hypothetical protein
MPRCMSAILTMLLLSATFSSPSASAQTSLPDAATVKAEREASSRAFVLCQIRAVKRLDDQKSDPATIARGALSACGREFDENVKVHTRYLQNGLEGQQKVAKAAREAGLDAGIQIVLRNRKAR